MSSRPLITGLVSERKVGTRPDLSRHEQIVLEAICRFPDRQAITARINGERQMTQAEWAAARASLITKRLLNAVGEVTTRGRQAIGADL